MPLDSARAFDLPDAASRALNGVSDLAIAEVGAATYLITSGFQDDGLSVFALQEDGSLTDVMSVFDGPGTDVAGPFSVTTVTVGGAVYVLTAASGDDAVTVFAIDADGMLTLTDSFADTDELGLEGVANLTTADIAGTTFVIAAGATGDTVTVLTLAEDGTLGFAGSVAAPEPGDPPENGVGGGEGGGGAGGGEGGGDVPPAESPPPEPDLPLDEPFGLEAVTIGDSTYLYVTARLDNTLTAFSMDADGSLTVIETVEDTDDLALAGAYGLQKFTADGTTYLAVAGLDDSGLSTFTVNPDGTLTPKQTLFDGPTETLGGAARMTVAEVAGIAYLFVTSFSEDAIGAYAITPEGDLEYVGSLFDDGDINLGGAFSVVTAAVGDASYMIGGGFDDDGVSVFEIFDTIPAIDPDLGFTVAENAPTETFVGDANARIGTGVVDEGVTFAILAGNTDYDGDGVDPFAIDPETGVVTVVDGGDLDFESDPLFTVLFEAFNTATGDAATAEFTVNLTDADDLPVAVDDAVSTEEDSTVTGNLFDDNGFGVDTDDGIFALAEIGGTLVDGPTTVDLPSGARITASPNGAFTYDPNGIFKELRAGESVTDTIAYRIDDGISGSAVAELTVTINGEDALIDLDPLTEEASEGNIEGATFSFVVRRTGQTDSLITMNYGVVSGTGAGVNGVDFPSGVLPGGEIILLPGQTEATFEVQVSGDFVFEDDETITVGLSQLNAAEGVATIVDGLAQARVLNDDSFAALGTISKDKFKGEDVAEVVDALEGRDTLKLKGGDDIGFGGAGRDKLDGGDGNDVLLGDAGDDKIKGGDGADILRGGLGNDKIRGDDGNDRIDGDGGDDKIRGGDGADILRGGAGDDELRGDKGSDIFVFAGGDERVTVRDFDLEEDLLDLTGVGRDIGDFQELLGFVTSDGKDLVFTFGEGDVLTLRKVDADDLSFDLVLI